MAADRTALTSFPEALALNNSPGWGLIFLGERFKTRPGSWVSVFITMVPAPGGGSRSSRMPEAATPAQSGISPRKKPQPERRNNGVSGADSLVPDPSRWWPQRALSALRRGACSSGSRSTVRPRGTCCRLSMPRVLRCSRSLTVSAATDMDRPAIRRADGGPNIHVLRVARPIRSPDFPTRRRVEHQGG